MKHPISLVLAILLILSGAAVFAASPAKFIGMGLAGIGALVFLFPRLPFAGRITLGVLVAGEGQRCDALLRNVRPPARSARLPERIP